MGVYNSVWALVMLPLFGAALSFLAESPRRAAQICFAASLLSLLVAAVVLGARLTHPLQPPFESLVTFFGMSPPESAVFATRLQAQIGVFVDSLSASFGFALAFVIATVQAYALTSLRADSGYRRFFWSSSLLAFASLSLVFSPNLFYTLLTWMVASVAAYLLTAHWRDRSDAAAPARRVLLALHTADIALLLGVVVVLVKFGGYSSQIPAPAGQSAADPLGFDQLTRYSQAVLQGLVHGAGLRSLAVMAAILIFAAVLRGAQLPLHAWLTETATAPVPALALILGGVGFAGAYLVARAYPLLLAPLHAISALALTGAVTAAFAAAVCLAQRDVLRIVVFAGLAQLGLAIAALGAGGFGQGLFVLFSALLFTTLLALGAGNLVRLYRTRNIHEMGGARRRMRSTTAALLVWAGGTSGLSLATYYALSSAFENAKPSGPAVGGATRIAVAVLVVVAACLMAASAWRLLWFVLPGEPVRRRGFQPERVTEAEPGLRRPLLLATSGAVASVLVGLPGMAPVHSGRLSIPGLTFTRFVYEYGRPSLPVDGAALVICLAAGLLGAAVAWYAFAPARREQAAARVAWAAPFERLAARDFDLERYAHRLGAPFVLAGGFVSRFDDTVTETLGDLAAEGSDHAAALLERARTARTSLYLAGGLALAAILALLSVLAATGHFWIHSL